MLRTRLFATLLLLVAMVGGANTVSASGGCKSYSGSFTAVRPNSCASLVGICTHGTLIGGFPSTYDFTADTLIPTGNPGEFAYTATAPSRLDRALCWLALTPAYLQSSRMGRRHSSSRQYTSSTAPGSIKVQPGASSLLARSIWSRARRWAHIRP